VAQGVAASLRVGFRVTPAAQIAEPEVPKQSSCSARAAKRLTTARQALVLDRISYNDFKTGVLQRLGDERDEGSALIPGKAEAVSAGSVSIGSEPVPAGPTSSMSASGSVSRASSSRASGCTRVGHHTRICRASAAAATVSES
jgi:hypothetical protein